MVIDEGSFREHNCSCDRAWVDKAAAQLHVSYTLNTSRIILAHGEAKVRILLALHDLSTRAMLNQMKLQRNYAHALNELFE